ncbi:hypothetical protein AAII07_45135 [Microvirga sp. 0TCS3.31]
MTTLPWVARFAEAPTMATDRGRIMEVTSVCKAFFPYLHEDRAAIGCTVALMT